MIVVFVAFAVLVILGAALVLVGRVGTGTDEVDASPALPEPPLTAAAVRGLRFRVGLRGYRMSDVDAALAAIAADLEQRHGSADVDQRHGSADVEQRRGAAES